jgi:ABC-type transport system involved in multi-copper enzyme maturation permease subunit
MFQATQFAGLFSTFAPIAAGATDSWLTKWLTPIWFLGVGVALGLVALIAFILVTRILSAIPAWEGLSKSQAGHVVALVITGVLTAVAYYFVIVPIDFSGTEATSERLMLLIAVGLLSAIVGWSVVFCCSSQAAKNAWSTVSEGAAGFIVATGIVVVVAALLSTLVVEKPQNVFASLPQLFSTGAVKYNPVIPATQGVDADLAPYTLVDITFDPTLLDRVEIKTKQSITLADAEQPEYFSRAPRRMERDETISWNRNQKSADSPLTLLEGSRLYVQNREIDPAELEITIVTRPAVPQASTILIAGLAVFLIGLTILLQQAVAPRASAIALATVKNELAQPLFLVLMALGILAILLFEFLPFNTFGEDIKLLKECGITTIMLLAAFQGIWSASSSISEEIEGRTALTVLSKPIQRRSFVIGKFLGVFWLLFLMFIILGTFELGAVAYKPIYDARENSVSELVWQTCHQEMVSTVPGLAMAFMEALILSAISVALATRVPQLANLAICFAIYVVGNLTTSLVNSTDDGFEIVRFVAQLVATIIPILDHFSLQAAIDAGNPITMSLLAGSLVYCLLYVMLSMFLALLLFEDRDLA